MTPLLCPKYEVKRVADYSFAAYASEANLKNVEKDDINGNFPV